MLDELSKFVKLRVLLALGAWLMAAGLACSAIGPSGTRIEQPEFLTPIADAQNERSIPYWLGQEFSVGDTAFTINAETGFNTARQGGPGLFLSYGGAGTLTIQTFINTATLDDSLRAQAKGEPGYFGASYRSRMEGTLYTLPAGERPVNTLGLFLDSADTPVLVVAHARSSGVPGDDPNPLIDAELLIDKSVCSCGRILSKLSCICCGR